MASKKRPIKTVFKKGGSILTNAEKRMKEEVLDTSISKARLMQAKVAQLEIDRYNNVDIYKIDPFFKKVQLSGPWMIVRLKMENLIKYINEDNPENPIIDAWVRQIDGRQRTTDQPFWVPTPFPFIEEGVIVAISPAVQKEYHELKEKISAYDITLANSIVIPQVGDTVHIRANNSGWYKEHRYYTDKQKQCSDFVRNQMELRLNNFHNYFRLEDFELENVVLGNSKALSFYEDESIPSWYTDQDSTYEAQIKELNDSIELLTTDTKNTLMHIVDDSISNLSNADQDNQDNVILESDLV